MGASPSTNIADGFAVVKTALIRARSSSLTGPAERNRVVPAQSVWPGGGNVLREVGLDANLAQSGLQARHDRGSFADEQNATHIK
jgi:hypothetical protein